MKRPTLQAPYTLAPDEGNAVWFLDTLMTVKIDAAATHGAYMVVECLLSPGFGPPMHIHHADDEAFYIISGELSGVCGDVEWRGGPGTFVFMPRGIPHRFTVESAEAAQVLQLGNGSGFEQFVSEAGQPAMARTLPPTPPGPTEIGRMLATAPKFDIEMLMNEEPTDG